METDTRPEQEDRDTQMAGHLTHQHNHSSLTAGWPQNYSPTADGLTAAFNYT